MYLQRNILALLPYQCYNETVAMRFVCIVSCQQYKNIECCTKIISWRIYVGGNNKMYLRLHAKCPRLFPILTKSGVSRQTFIKVQNIQFRGTPSSGSRAFFVRTADGHRDEHDGTNRLFSLLCERA